MDSVYLDLFQHQIINLSQVEVLKSEQSCYAAKIDDKAIVKIGDDFWSPYGISGHWDLRLHGRGWAIWIKN
ncbi:MAG: hypothetical protein H6632_16015 [Anaerolineales bacterium]|nr:hypothetical protein [Anaerolineales bacterium]